MRYTVTLFARESVGLCPFRGFYGNPVSRIIAITHAHNLHLKVLDFDPFTIRTLKNANCLPENLFKRF